MKEREYKGWEIIKLLEERKLKDGTKIKVIKETGETYVCGYIIYDNKIYHKSSLSLVCDFPVCDFPTDYKTPYKTPIDVEKFASNNIFKIEKKIEYMTLQEAVATKKPLRLNEEWSKKLVETDDINENNEGEEYKLLTIYQTGGYLYIQDMLIMLGWFLSGKDLRKLISSNKKVWCVEDVF